MTNISFTKTFNFYTNPETEDLIQRLQSNILDIHAPLRAQMISYRGHLFRVDRTIVDFWDFESQVLLNVMEIPDGSCFQLHIPSIGYENEITDIYKMIQMATCKFTDCYC